MPDTSILILELDNESQELAAKDQLQIFLNQENFKTFNIFFNRRLNNEN